ncbi:fungal-specific transcription factor domain-containing protein, partial [Ilyonectria sp. MPI-CAGE-AT-0026]
ASQLRIQSILSPADPEVDELSNVSSSHSTPKRKFEDVFTASEAPVALRRTESLDESQPRPEGSGIEPSIGHAEEQGIFGPSGARDGKRSMKMRPPMRSSIACMRCRRSKIKCDNDGGSSPCDTCIKGGHQCQYPDATPLPSKRNDPPNVVRQEKEGAHERKRARKVDETPGLDNERSTAYAEEVLSYPFLTTDLWDQLLSIYRLHFATELSFLHLPTLKEKVSHRQRPEYEPSPELNLVLLGGSSRPRASQSKIDPSAASDFFANVLATALGPLKTAITFVTVERVQAFLMLGLFEWSQRNPSSGPGAWMYVGIAIRMAQMLKLGLDDQMARGRDSSSQGVNALQRGRRGSSEIGIIREIRRRTMFSCLILDRMMTCGDERVSMIRLDTIRIQLPCTEMAFDLALDVSTGFLKLDGDFMSQSINDDSVLSRFVQLVEIWAEISKYSSTGGRLRERLPPWEKQSMFWTLREKLYQFLLNLPDTFTFSRQNYYRHDNHQATNMYVSLHMLVSVSQIILDREHLPFIPLRCNKPEGAFITPPIPPNEAPVGFWEEVTDTFFKAGQDIVDLVDICRDKLPQSSLVLFGVWLAGFAGVYAHNFPYMDTKHQMVSQEDIDRQDGGPDLPRMTTELTYHTLQKMSSSLQGAQNYLKHLEEIDRYYMQVGTKFRETPEKSGPLRDASGHRRLSIRLGGDEPRVENRATSRPAEAQHRSMLMLPGTEPERLLASMPEFSLDQLGLIESQRIGRMLNDLEEFSGAGSLGAGMPLNEYDMGM